MERVQTLVVGAGVVGLATAAELARRGRSVLIVERELVIGAGVSSRNSEVIHAGLYYSFGSAKARLCVLGKAKIYAYCEARGVPHKRLGKLLVATSATQLSEALPRLQRSAEANGVSDLRFLSSADACSLEPNLECAGALLSPSSGIVDSHGLMTALLGDAEACGAILALGARVEGATRSAAGRTLVRVTSAEHCTRVDGTGASASAGAAASVGGVAGQSRVQGAAGTAKTGPGPGVGAAEGLLLDCDEVVNCAGLSSVRLGRTLISGVGACQGLCEAFAKGSYFGLAAGTGPPPFSHLVYPLPEANLGGLGVHATPDMSGRVRFGPDLEWLGDRGRPDTHPDNDPAAYAVDPSRATAFYKAIRAYWPGLRDGALVPDYAGIRPKLSREGEAPADFCVAHDAPGVWHACGIESPGLTASLALAEDIADRVIHSH